MGQPWVYARSIFPVSTLKGKLRHLKTLGDQSLGSVLFKDPSMKRTVFEIAMLAQQSIDALKHCDSNRSLWGRRSKFFLHKKPVLVTEVFLPPLEQYASKVRL